MLLQEARRHSQEAPHRGFGVIRTEQLRKPSGTFSQVLRGVDAYGSGF